MIVDVEGWNEPRGKCSGATAVRGVSLVPRPAEIASRRRGRGQQVDLLVSILAHVRDPEIAGGRVEMEPERIAEAHRVDQSLAGIRARRERIGGRGDERPRSRAARPARQRAHVEPQDLAVEVRGILRRAGVEIVSEARVEHSVGAEAQRAAVVIRVAITVAGQDVVA